MGSASVRKIIDIYNKYTVQASSFKTHEYTNYQFDSERNFLFRKKRNHIYSQFKKVKIFMQFMTFQMNRCIFYDI